MASDREALVEQIGDDVEAGTAEAWRIATGQRLAHRDRMIIRQALDVALAAVEAAGWGPPEPVTADETVMLAMTAQHAADTFMLGQYYRSDAEYLADKWMSVAEAVLRSDVLRRRGIVVAEETT